jgi:GDP-L-fucose synthase
MAEYLRLLRSSGVFVAGHRGLVGSAIVRRLEALGCRNVLVRSHSELDLSEQVAVGRFFREHRPEFVFLSAARVGGILANSTRPAEFLAR